MQLSRLSAIVLLFAAASSGAIQAASAPEATDTVLAPNVNFKTTARTYTIAGIEVTGAPNYDPDVVRSYAALKVGDLVEVPGTDISNAAKRLMAQGLFAQVQVKVQKTVGNQIWLEYALRQQPRIGEIKFTGVKKHEREDLQERLHLNVGNQITPNVVNTIERITREYYDGKGFKNATVNVTQRESSTDPNEVILGINVDKQSKIKVHRIYIDGNQVLSDGKIKRTMKKTNEKGSLRKLFSQKKFVKSDYRDDLERIIQKYNEYGYRDAVIVSDSVAPFDDSTVDVFISLDEGRKYYIGDIKWVGNTVYNTELLDYLLEMKPGDVYNQTLLQKRLVNDDDAVSNLYYNNGYLFSQIVNRERNVRGDTLDLELYVHEGAQARINAVNINGNDRLYEKVVRRELRTRPGDLFSKDNLMRSAREIQNMQHFNPESVSPDIKPNYEDGSVDVDFNLESKASDQVEFSLGWGQTGLIAKVGLKFTNFAIKNLFYPSTYKGLIPQGEGQTFSINAQTNARYYQAYSISFLDPWFGGKRPNQLSVTAYFSRQTGVNSSYYNSNYYNNYYNYYGYSYGYGSSYNYNSSYTDAYDPNQVLQQAGVSIGFGKRLSWPDDYFTFNADLSYNWYYLKNWQYLYYMNNGVSNSLVLGLTLARSDVDNYLYTRKGTSFSLNLQITPPASLFSPGRDWDALAAKNDEDAKKELYKWLEYWKLRFNSKTYTPLTNPEHKYTLVLMTRADFGLIGSYNKNLKTPFETFYVGGDGMSGSYTYATETIGLRGYDNGAFTPYSNGYAYTRFGVELHFPFLLNPSTTIYGLTFAEAGNAWTSVSNFAPFNLKRSAGVGLRIYLPMVGLMGIDWAYGFDKVYGTRGGSHFHFVLGQEF
jgi:outer membrane protein insertion porin family